MLKEYSSFYDLMREFLPRLDWDRLDRRRRIGCEEVLAWADAHYARHGKWPTCESGKIPGIDHTWMGIDKGLRNGRRGLPGRTSLARFLEKHRGLRVQGNSSLFALHHSIGAALTAAIGFQPEELPYAPHITLARLNSPAPPDAVERFLWDNKDLLIPPVLLKRFVLYSSVAVDGVPQYQEEATFFLIEP